MRIRGRRRRIRCGASASSATTRSGMNPTSRSHWVRNAEYAPGTMTMPLLRFCTAPGHRDAQVVLGGLEVRRS